MRQFILDYQVEIIRRGIEHWEEKTCIRFQPWTGQQDYINIHSGSFGWYGLHNY